MTYDVTKVTYNMYSCYKSFMSREMMETDGRDSAKCQNWGKKEHNGHYLNFNGTKRQNLNSVVSYLKKEKEKT